MRRHEDRDFPVRDLAAMPACRQAEIPWLLISGAVLITPFSRRPGGPTASEMAAIKEMQKRLVGSPVAVWISPDGRLTPQAIASDVIEAKTASNVTVRLRPASFA